MHMIAKAADLTHLGRIHRAANVLQMSRETRPRLAAAPARGEKSEARLLGRAARPLDTGPLPASRFDPVSRTVILSAVRTPFGRLGGGLKDHAATDLGAIAIRAGLERAGIERGEVEY